MVQAKQSAVSNSKKNTKEKPKVALIWPPLIYDHEIPHLALPILASQLEKKGYDYKVIDINKKVNEQIKNSLWTRIPVNLFSHLLKESKDILYEQLSYYYINLINKKIAPDFDKAIYNSLKINKNKKNYNIIKQATRINLLNIDKTINDFIKKVANYDIIAISITFAHHIYYALRIARIIKNSFKNKIIIIGGSQITMNYKHLMKEKKLTSIIDIMILYEGENTFIDILEYISREYKKNKQRHSKKIKIKPTNITNIIYSNNGKFSMTKIIPNLSKEIIVPRYNKSGRYITMRLSKGCYWAKCAFCSHSILECNKYIIAAPQQAFEKLKELDNLYNLKERMLILADNSLPPKFLKELSYLIIKNNLKTNWWIMNTIPTEEFANDEFMRLLAKAGCKKIGFGFETINNRILKLMNKIHKADLTYSIYKTGKNNNIEVRGSYILGFPGEEEHETLQTIKFIKMLYNKRLGFSRAQEIIIEDNTPLKVYRKKYGIEIIDEKKVNRMLNYDYKVRRGISQQKAIELSNFSKVLFSESRLKKLYYLFKLKYGPISYIYWKWKLNKVKLPKELIYDK